MKVVVVAIRHWGSITMPRLSVLFKRMLEPNRSEKQFIHIQVIWSVIARANGGSRSIVNRDKLRKRETKAV
jgi:hypothetical protein